MVGHSSKILASEVKSTTCQQTNTGKRDDLMPMLREQSCQQAGQYIAER